MGATQEESGMIGGNDDKGIAAHLELTHDFADKILQSADEDPNDAFLRAVGILAQVIFATVNGEHREEILGVAADKLRNYLNLLDEVNGMGKMDARRALIGFRADAVVRAAIVEWAENQPDRPTLSEAIRRLVELGLTIEARPAQITPARAERAARIAATAGKQLDQLADSSASAEEQATRKRSLLKAPEEFQSVRIDRSAKK
jgi:hypothetical protein